MTIGTAISRQEFPFRTLFVGGDWSDGSGPVLDVVNPADETVLIRLPAASTDEVGAAVRAARDAFLPWARLPAMVRGKYVRGMADLLGKYRDRFTELLVADVGKPASEAAAEVTFAESILRYNAEFDRRLEGEILPGDSPNEVIHLERHPLGVVAAILPWNFPLAVLCRKVAPALVAGNTVVVKPSEVAPLCAFELVRLAHEELDLPPGVFNAVFGPGGTGAALVDASGVDMVSFTGHRDTGKRIAAAAAANLTRVAVELGGKAPAIVLPDADVDNAVAAIIAARHTNAGQVCTAAERVFVHEDVAPDFTAKYVAAAQDLTIGLPSGAVDMGPLASRAQYDKTERAVAGAVRAGAQVLVAGGRPVGKTFERGYWWAPTVLADVSPDMDIMREEVFGPVTPIHTVTSLDEALSMANESRYGLSAYIYSNNYAQIMRAARELQFGELYINRTAGESVHAHHAGFKESGIGGEDGKWGFLRYTQIKTVYHRYG